MFVLSGVKKRYYEFQAPDNKQVLHIEPPKLKTLNRMNDLSRPDSTPKEAAEVVARVIAKNKEHRKITADTVMEWMDMDQLAGFVLDFVSWLSNEKKNDPNYRPPLTQKRTERGCRLRCAAQAKSWFPNTRAFPYLPSMTWTLLHSGRFCATV